MRLIKRHNHDKTHDKEGATSDSPLLDQCLRTTFWWVPSPMRYFFEFNMENSIPESSFIEDTAALPRIWKIITAVAYNCFYLGLMMYFLYTSYSGGRTKTFISLEEDAGDCVEVGRPTSGNFLVSASNGQDFAWSSQESYDSNSTLYGLSLESFTSTVAGFSEQMSYVDERLAALGAKGATRDLSWNLLAWMSFRYSNTTDATGSFEFTTKGEPEVVYNMAEKGVTFSSAWGYCDYLSEVVFDPYTSTYHVSMLNYMDTKPCVNQFDAAKLSAPPLSPLATQKDFNFKVDMRSVVIAQAINMGILNISTLTPMRGTIIGTNDDHDYYFDDELPTEAPTAAPTSAPSTSAPSFSPTYSPTVAVGSPMIAFSSSIDFSGVSAATLNSDPAAQVAAVEATAASMGNGVTANMLTFVSATDVPTAAPTVAPTTSRRRLAEASLVEKYQNNKRRLASGGCTVEVSCNIPIDVVSGASTANDAYSTVTTALANSVSSGAYNTAIADAAAAHGTSALNGTTVTSVTDSAVVEYAATAAPTTNPTTLPPSAAPTVVPTMSPTYAVGASMMSFTATLALDGINAATLMADATAQLVIRNVSSYFMAHGVSIDSIEFVNAAAVESTRRLMQNTVEDEYFIFDENDASKPHSNAKAGSVHAEAYYYYYATSAPTEAPTAAPTAAPTTASCVVELAMEIEVSSLSRVRDGADALSKFNVSLRDAIDSGDYDTMLQQFGTSSGINSLDSVAGTSIVLSNYVEYVVTAHPTPSPSVAPTTASRRLKANRHLLLTDREISVLDEKARFVRRVGLDVEKLHERVLERTHVNADNAPVEARPQIVKDFVNNKRMVNLDGGEKPHPQQHLVSERINENLDFSKNKKTRRELIQESHDKINYNLHGRVLDTAIYDTPGQFTAYYSDNYVGMDPIYCFAYDVGGHSCFTVMESTLMYPVTNSLGTFNLTSLMSSYYGDMTATWNNDNFRMEYQDMGVPDWTSHYCDCANADRDEFKYCHDSMLMNSLIFFGDDENSNAHDGFGAISFERTLKFAHDNLVEMQQRGDEGDKYLQRKVYNPAITAVYNFFGINFNENFETGGIFMPSAYPDLMAPLCENCTILNIFGASKLIKKLYVFVELYYIYIFNNKM